jgi:hypothetical protein
MSYRLFDSHLRKASQTDSGMLFGTLSGASTVVMVSSTPAALALGADDVVVPFPAETCLTEVGAETVDSTGNSRTTATAVVVVDVTLRLLFVDLVLGFGTVGFADTLSAGVAPATGICRSVVEVVPADAGVPIVGSGATMLVVGAG